MSIRTSPAVGTGSGSSPYSMTSGPPKRRMKEAFISLGEEVGRVERVGGLLQGTAGVVELEPSGLREHEPHFLSARGEVGVDLVARLLAGIRRRDDLHAQLGCSLVWGFETVGAYEIGAGPGNVGNQHPDAREHRSLGECPATQIRELCGQCALQSAVIVAGGAHHHPAPDVEL